MGDNSQVDSTLTPANVSDELIARIASQVVAAIAGGAQGGELLQRANNAGDELVHGVQDGNLFRNGPANLQPGDKISNQTVDLVRNSQANIQRSGIDTATGYTGYDLKTPAATLVPFMTPLLNMTPREQGVGVPVHNWKAITDLFGGNGPSSFAAGVADGGTPNFLSRSVVSMANTFQTLAALDSITFQADWRARQLQGDLRSVVPAQLLVALKMVEEYNLINWSDYLWTPAPLLLSATNSGGTITNASNGTMWFRVTAVNAQGETLGTSLQSVTIPGTTSSITLTIFTVPNATKYNIYAAQNTGSTPSNGATWLQSAASQFGGASALNQPAAGVGSFTATMTAPPATSGTAYSAVVTAGNTAKVQVDGSGNILSFQGALSMIFANAATAVTNATGGLKTNVIQPVASGGYIALSDIDQLLLNIYNNARGVPTHLFVSPQDSISLSNLVAANGNTRIVLDGSRPEEQTSLTSGVRVGQILNKATQTMVKIVPLPFLTQGTIMAGSMSFPYPITGYSSNPFRLIQNKEYYGVEYPPTLTNPMKYGYGDFVDETLVNEFLGGWGCISGIVYH